MLYLTCLKGKDKACFPDITNKKQAFYLKYFIMRDKLPPSHGGGIVNIHLK